MTALNGDLLYTKNWNSKGEIKIKVYLYIMIRNKKENYIFLSVCFIFCLTAYFNFLLVLFSMHNYAKPIPADSWPFIIIMKKNTKFMFVQTFKKNYTFKKFWQFPMKNFKIKFNIF